MKPQHFAELTRQVSGILVDLEDRYRAAYNQARPPARRRQPGEITSSIGTHSDPTQHTAMLLSDLLDRIVISTTVLRDDAQHLARSLTEWGPDRSHPALERRCTMNDCAKPQQQRGLCDMHRKREDRARLRVQDAS